MSLQDWVNSGWLRPHQSSSQEITQLLAIADRDFEDALTPGLSDDWKFGIAYNAALKLCTILVHASGYRPEKMLQHYRTIQALPLILGSERKAAADYLDKCRLKRNTVEYDKVGAATKANADELLAFARSLRSEVLDWLKENHPNLMP
jgi:hypothetical protein